jgi:hypothetical protein
MESRGTHKLGVADKLASEPEEGLLEVVVGLGGDVVVLQVLLAVEGDGLGLDLALLHVDLVTGEDDGDVLADTDKVTLKLKNISIEIGLDSRSQSNSRCQLGTFL